MQTKQPTQLHLSTYYSTEYRIHVHPADTPEDVLDPKWYAHVARRLRPGDTIVFVAEDMSWVMRALVRHVGAHEVFLGVIEHKNFDAAPADDMTAPEGFEVKWRGPARKYSVVRLSDGAILKDEFPSKEQAIAYMKNKQKALAA